MTREELRTLVALTLGRQTVKDADLLVEDLGAESMDLIAILGVIEDRFGICLDESDLVEVATVGDLCELAQQEKG